MRQGVLIFIINICLLAGCPVYCKAQDTIARPGHVAHYLADTLNAPSKIKELINFALKASDDNDNIAAIEDYQIALALVPYAGDSLDILTSLYARFSGLLHSSGAENMATLYAEKALMERRKANKKATVWEYNLIGRIGSSYLIRKQYDSSEIYFIEAKRVAWATGQHLSMAAAENNLGMLYELRNMHDSALYAFIRSIKILSPSNKNDSILLGSIYDNIALNYVSRNKFDTAEKYYRQNNILFTRIKIPIGIFKSEIGTANCMITLHKYSCGLSFINQAENCMAQNADYFNPNNRITLIQCRQHYYSAIGDLKQALVQQAEIAAIKDSLDGEQIKISDKLLKGLTDAEIMKANRGIEIYNLKLQQNKASLEESRKSASMRLLLAIIIALSGAAIILLLMIYFRNRQRIHYGEIKLGEQKEQLAKSELERQKLEQEKIERELINKKDDLRNLGTYLTELKDMQETVAEKLGEIKNQKAEQQKSSISILLNELNSKIHSQERLQVINKSIEDVNAEFHKKLISLHPNLTKTELELCGYFKLNMSNKEISILKGISFDAVKKGRYRLRKKLGLEPEGDIYKTLIAI
jgi:hypothetical protein